MQWETISQEVLDPDTTVSREIIKCVHLPREKT